MTALEQRKLYTKICYEVSKMMPDTMTDAEYFAIQPTCSSLCQ